MISRYLPLRPKFNREIIPQGLRQSYEQLHCRIRELTADDIMHKHINAAMNSLKFTIANCNDFVVDRIFAIEREAEVGVIVVMK